MIDESSQERMEKALLSDNKDEAVRLSQELDKQITEAQKLLANKGRDGD